MEKTKIPEITFFFREGDVSPKPGACPIGGRDVLKTTADIFAGKRVVVFSLPGAFTPVCSSKQLPSYEELYPQIKAAGIDEVYVASVNDPYVMNAWLDYMNIQNVKALPDGNGDLAHALGMLADFSVAGLAMRSKRFAMVVNDAVVEKAFIEPDASESDPSPYGVSAPETVLSYLKG